MNMFKATSLLVVSILSTGCMSTSVDTHAYRSELITNAQPITKEKVTELSNLDLGYKLDVDDWSTEQEKNGLNK